MLKISDIVVSYGGGIKAIDGLSLEVKYGEVVTIIGANGAGKSACLMTISGILRCEKGSIEFLGEPIHRTPSYKILRKGVVQVPEGRQIFAQMTVVENLLMGAYSERNKAVISEKMDKVTSLFPILEKRARQMAGTLSGGEAQMLAIARGLMSNPKLLMLDEPSLGLAPLIVKNIFKVIQEFDALGITALIVEQNARQALQCSKRAYVMEVGRITLEGASMELLNDEKVVEAYLGGEKQVKKEKL